MRPLELHRWDVTPKEAVAIQRELRDQIVLRDELGTVRLVAGADIALDKKESLGFGGVVVFAFPSLEEVERATAAVPLTSSSAPSSEPLKPTRGLDHG